MGYSRKTIENPSDRQQLEMSEARVLFATWKHLNQKVMTRERIEYLEKRYGRGSVNRIIDYMKEMQNGNLD